MQHLFKSVILVFLFSLSSIVLAEESCINENKDNGTGNDVSDADRIGNSGCSPALCVTDNSSVTSTINQHNQVIIERRRQLEQAHREAYKQHLLRREQQSAFADADLPDEVKARRQEYFKNMEQRRELFYRMIEQHRQEAAEKRAASKFRTHNFKMETDSESKSVSL
jgi:hypothetical protein